MTATHPRRPHRVLRSARAILSLFAVISLLCSSGIVPFTFAALAATSGDHEVGTGLDEEHFRIRLIHIGPKEQFGHKGESHHHALPSKVVTFFADAHDRDGGDHNLQFHRLRNGLSDSAKVVIEKPDFVLLTAGIGFEYRWNPDFSLHYNTGEWPRLPCSLALVVVRFTVLLI